CAPKRASRSEHFWRTFIPARYLDASLVVGGRVRGRPAGGRSGPVASQHRGQGACALLAHARPLVAPHRLYTPKEAVPSGTYTPSTPGFGTIVHLVRSCPRYSCQ